MCLEVASEDGSGVRILVCECSDMVTNVSVSGYGAGVVCCKEIGANEEDGSGSRGANEDRGNARGEVGGSM